MLYVIMTDTFLSGWGPFENKVNKYVIKCRNSYQAEAVARAAEKRNEMVDVQIKTRLGTWPVSDYMLTFTDFENLNGPWLEFYNPDKDMKDQLKTL